MPDEPVEPLIENDELREMANVFLARLVEVWGAPNAPHTHYRLRLVTDCMPWRILEAMPDATRPVPPFHVDAVELERLAEAALRGARGVFATAAPLTDDERLPDRIDQLKPIILNVLHKYERSRRERADDVRDETERTIRLTLERARSELGFADRLGADVGEICTDLEHRWPRQWRDDIHSVVRQDVEHTLHALEREGSVYREQFTPTPFEEGKPEGGASECWRVRRVAPPESPAGGNGAGAKQLGQWMGGDAGTFVVVLTDIIASMKRESDVGRDQAYKEVRAHLDAVKSHATANDGFFVKGTGDGALVLYRVVPDAVDFALYVSKDPGVQDLPLRVVLHKGVIKRIENDIHGATVGIATRICKAMKPPGIYASNVAYEDITKHKNPNHISLNWVRPTIDEPIGLEAQHEVWSATCPPNRS